MKEEALNVSTRKFLKKVGVTAQREIEAAVRAALAKGKLKGHETIPARILLTVFSPLLSGHRDPTAARGLSLRSCPVLAPRA